jgi:hypothetical protein
MKKLQVILAVTLMAFSSLVFSANAALCDEITNDPLGRGYAGMGVEAITADINSEYRLVFHEKVEGADLFEGVVGAEWQAISEAEKTQVLSLLSFGAISPQGNVRTFLITIFGGGSGTISNMADIARYTTSRAAELDLGSPNAGAVQTACE